MVFFQYNPGKSMPEENGVWLCPHALLLILTIQLRFR